jgi:hypothetical protein
VPAADGSRLKRAYFGGFLAGLLSAFCRSTGHDGSRDLATGIHHDPCAEVSDGLARDRSSDLDSVVIIGSDEEFDDVLRLLGIAFDGWISLHTSGLLLLRHDQRPFIAWQNGEQRSSYRGKAWTSMVL